MPLTLSLRKHHAFFVGDTRVEVTDVVSPYEFSVKAKGYPEKKVVPDVWTPIMPGAEVQVGVPQHQHGQIVRVMIQAPGIKIVREGAKDPHSTCEVCHGTKLLRVEVTCPHCKGFGCSPCSGSGRKLNESQCPECQV